MEERDLVRQGDNDVGIALPVIHSEKAIEHREKGACGL
jgi:hypothetical protein